MDNTKKEYSIEEASNSFLNLLKKDKTVVFIFNKEGRYVDLTTEFPHLLYMPAEEILGKTVHEIFTRPLANLAQQTIDAVFLTGKCISVEYELPIGRENYWFDATAIPFSKNHVIWLARDITEVKTGEKLILDALSAIENITSSSEADDVLNEKVDAELID